MGWVFAALIVAVIGVAFLAGMGRMGQMSPQIDDRPVPALPDGPLQADDLMRLRFAVVARGYSMEQVDAVLDRLVEQLEPAAPEPTPDQRFDPQQLGAAPIGWPNQL